MNEELFLLFPNMKNKLLSLLLIGSMALSMATPLAAAAQESEDSLSPPATVSQDTASVAEESLSAPTTSSQDTVSVAEASSRPELTPEEISQMQQDFLNQEVTESGIINDTLSPPAEITLSPNSVNSATSYIYLSDLQHDDALSNLQWALRKNATPSGEGVQLTKDGVAWTYAHGLGFSTNNNGTTAELTYNIADYAANYPIFHAYLGVDTRQTGKGDGAIIEVYTSADGQVWNLVQEPVLHTAGSAAIEITVDISQASYIKFSCDKNQNNSYDHVAIADPRLMVSGYDLESEIDPPLLTTQEYDAQISQLSVEQNYTSNLHQVLLRELVDRLGYDAIISATTPCMYEYTEGTREALEWFKQDMDALQLFIEAGEYFSGNSKKALIALGRLYSAHADDMDNPVYRKMLLATAAAYSKVIKSYTTNYGGNAVMSDPVIKYERFKELYDRGDFVYPEQFAEYPMELVRAVMDCKIDDDEIFWLSDKIDATYPNTSNTARLNGYSFIAYKNASYGINAKPQFYDQEYYSTWNEKYNLEQYGISYGEPNLYRMWMFMEAGGVCWAVSNTGMVMAEVQGIPAINTYQPSHEAYLLYQIDSNGNGIWKLWNDVFGWQSSYTRWGSSSGFTEARLIFEWGQMDFNTLSGGNNTTYILLATDALNHYADYQQSMLYQLIANCYPQTSDEHIEALNTSLTHYDKNLDSIYALIKAYHVRENTSQEEWANLAKMVIDRYTFFPAPMVDVLKLITPHLTNGTYLAEVNVLKIAALNRAANATGADTPQDTACRNVAKKLLNSSTVPLATFSFDGENKNTIVLDPSYDDSEFAVRVSLDGKRSWLTFTEDGNEADYTYSHAITLTQDQIDQITADNDIIIGIVGTDTTYTIDIKAGNAIQDSAVYKNDNENLLLGTTDHMEYSYDGETWYDYESGLTSSTRFEGAVSVFFRYKSYGTYLTGPIRSYQFYEDGNTDECSYLPLQYISLEDFSSQQGGQNQYATNLIDGNANTVWHTSWNGDNNRTYTVALDDVRYITKIGYMSGTDANGRPKSMDIYVSLDGQDWDLIKTASMANNGQSQYIELDEPVACRYIKLHGRETYANSENELNKFFAGRMLWLYEDKTQSYVSEAMIRYTPATWTNGSVTATLELPVGCHADVTEHVFTTNGTFDFTYTDANNVVHTITANVDFIDTTPPTASVAYSTTQWTNSTVTAQLTDISEDVVSIEPQIPEDGDFYFDYNEELHQVTFTNNGTFSFILTDHAGNTSQVDMTVKWIDHSKPEDDKALLETTVEIPDETGNMQSVAGYTLNVNPDAIEILGITRVSDGPARAVRAENGYVETENGYVIIQSGTYTYHLRLLSTQYEFDYTVNVQFPDSPPTDGTDEGGNGDTGDTGDNNDGSGDTGDSGAGSGGGGAGGGGGASVPEKTPTVTIQASSGSATVDNAYALPGNTVTITANGNDPRVTATDSSGNSVAVTDNGDGTYSFIMPEGTVSITVVFAGDTTTPNPDQTGVAEVLNTVDHVAYITGYSDGSFAPENTITRAEVATIFYRLLLETDVQKASFTDVKSDAWYYDAVTTLAGMGILQGYEDGTFRPSNPINRAEFATIATRFASATQTEAITFPDVAEDVWYYQAVCMASAFGWVNGYEDGTFRPNNLINRSESVKIVNRMLGRVADTAAIDSGTGTRFTDVSSSFWGFYDIVEASSAHTYTRPSGSWGTETWPATNE